MSETKNTLAQGMFVREHTFENGTRVMNVSIIVSDFSNFMLENMIEDGNGTNSINLKFIPNKTVGDNKLSHTPILSDYVRKPKDPTKLLQKLASVTIIEEEVDEKIAEKEQAIVEADKQEADLPF
tara:strand:+ start:178 stop:552 length:375 start_codon:yes stop_codon:yes gene_type:complete